MGRSNQHDFKITIEAILLLLCCTLFFSCDFLSYEKIKIDSQYSGDTSMNLQIKRDGKVYLGIWNKANQKILNENTPKVKRINHYLSTNELNNDEISIIVDKKNADFIQQYARKNARSASSLFYENAVTIDNTATIGDEKTFIVWRGKQVNLGDDYMPKSAKCVAVGNHCIIWNHDVDEIKLLENDFQKLAEKFDLLYEEETALVGSNKYPVKKLPYMINPQKRIDIFLDDLWDDLSEENTIVGYHSSEDLFTGTTYSNSSQIIYIDSLFVKKYPQTAWSTLIHEFNHLLNFCVKQDKIFQNSDGNYTWYTEMLSMLAEDALQEFMSLDNISSPKKRLIEYLNKGGTAYSPFSNFNITGDEIYNQYASTYAFGAYLVRNYGGLDLIHEIATNDDINELSIINALVKLGYISQNYKLNDFEEIKKAEPYIMINLEKNDDEDMEKINKPKNYKYRTLNRRWTSINFPNLALSEIDLNNIEFKTKNYTLVDLKVYDTFEKDKLIDIDSYLIYYLGENLKNVYIDVPENNEAEYILYFHE